MKKLVFFTIIFFPVMLFAAFPAAGAPGTACTRTADCDDGIFCNGYETCRFSVVRRAGVCTSGVPPCTRPTDVCVEGLRTCKPTCWTDDADGDGHIDANCRNASGRSLGDDCDDRDPNRYPGNIEVCDAAGHDEDCNPATFGTRDQDLDGFVDHTCCNHDTPDSLFCGYDCDDLNPGVHPFVPEVCNGIDDNCDALIDEGVSVSLYRDLDGDGHGTESSGRILDCAGTPGYSTLNNDCDDTNPAVQPGSMICSKGQEPTDNVLICSSNGLFIPALCLTGTCIVQPTGTGVCVP